MEHFDILDTDGKHTGEKKLREQVHADGDWHGAIDVCIINPKGEILIQKRTPNKDSYPNLWEISSSGHISAGETGIESAIREVSEELGLKFKKEDFEFLFAVKTQHITNNGTFINNEVKDIYLIETDIDINVLTLQKEEVSEVKLMHFTDFEKQILETPENFVPHEVDYKKLFEVLHERYNQ